MLTSSSSRWSRIVAVTAGLVLGILAGSAFGAQVTGAGATFPAPVYARWAEAYRNRTGIEVNYQAIGSGGGVRQIKAGTVDFGATDSPLSGAELAAANLVQFPAVVGGVVPVANLPGLGGRHLVLDGPTLAAIFDGRIERWNDAAIARLNPALELPDRAIVVVYRSDSSGTTSVFTEYLAAVSSPFAQTVGDGKTVDWPTGIGGKGNAGVAANVLKIRYTIGYVEFSFVKLTRLEPVAMVNRAGEVVMPRSEAFAAAARDADWRAVPGMGIGLTNQAAADAWPISAASFVLVPMRPSDPLRVADALRFFDWTLRNGQDSAFELGYVPLPPATATLVREAWREVLGNDGKPVLAGES